MQHLNLTLTINIQAASEEAGRPAGSNCGRISVAAAVASLRQFYASLKLIKLS